MRKEHQNNSLIRKLAPNRTLDANAIAFKTYGNYKKVVDVIERAELASGKKVIFKSDTGSTLNFEINRDGAYSTTAQTI